MTVRSAKSPVPREHAPFPLNWPDDAEIGVRNLDEDGGVLSLHTCRVWKSGRPRVLFYDDCDAVFDDENENENENATQAHETLEWDHGIATDSDGGSAAGFPEPITEEESIALVARLPLGLDVPMVPRYHMKQAKVGPVTFHLSTESHVWDHTSYKNQRDERVALYEHVLYGRLTVPKLFLSM